MMTTLAGEIDYNGKGIDPMTETDADECVWYSRGGGATTSSFTLAFNKHVGKRFGEAIKVAFLKGTPNRIHIQILGDRNVTPAGDIHGEKAFKVSVLCPESVRCGSTRLKLIRRRFWYEATFPEELPPARTANRGRQAEVRQAAPVLPKQVVQAALFDHLVPEPIPTTQALVPIAPTVPMAPDVAVAWKMFCDAFAADGRHELCWRDPATGLLTVIQVGLLGLKAR